MTKTSPTARATVSAGLCLLLAVSRPAEEGKAQARSDGSRELAATRWFEPRLTGSSVWQPCTTRLRQGHLVEEADCQAPHSTAQPVSRSHEDCDEVTATHRGALRALARLPRCTDAAVDRLKGLAAAGSRQDAASWNDLAAAYYVRAQRMDDPSDLPRSLDAAERAVAAAPQLLEARFNRALALEALGFSAEAQVAWDHLRRADSSRWAGEAGEHWTRLERDRALRAATSWPLNRQRLPEAVRAGDRTAVAKLIEPY
ncbi:MAG TPA: hypothetical protein VOA87_21395, partial [Thermoanaerobaculia bacterium]|nr:hypothetical protein [Thermoanaerobaculia bacterium]